MPQELLDKVIASQKFGQGFATLEYLKAVLIDQAWHTRPADQIPTDVTELENETFQKWGAQFPAIPPRYRSTYYSHIFAGDGYAANYFSYIWADVLVADSIDWFAKHGGLQRSSGDHFRATVLSHGGTVEAMDLFQQFTGHGPEVEPLLRKRGLE
jgi:peptidyl-dipeptidase Dcp